MKQKNDFYSVRTSRRTNHRRISVRMFWSSYNDDERCCDYNLYEDDQYVQATISFLFLNNSDFSDAKIRIILRLCKYQNHFLGNFNI